MRRAEMAITGGHVRLFSSSGDPLMEKWEKEIEEGKTPDLVDGFPVEERKKIRAVIEAKKKEAEKAKARQVKAFIDKNKALQEYKQLMEQAEFQDKYR